MTNAEHTTPERLAAIAKSDPKEARDALATFIAGILAYDDTVRALAQELIKARAALPSPEVVSGLRELSGGACVHEDAELCEHANSAAHEWIGGLS